jgi:hypothetical protein
VVHEIPCRLYALHAGNGDPLLLFGEDEAGEVFWWPTVHMHYHPFEFARWTKRNVHRWHGKRIRLQHPCGPAVKRWLDWLGVEVRDGEALI